VAAWQRIDVSAPPPQSPEGDPDSRAINVRHRTRRASQATAPTRLSCGCRAVPGQAAGGLRLSGRYDAEPRLPPAGRPGTCGTTWGMCSGDMCSLGFENVSCVPALASDDRRRTWRGRLSWPTARTSAFLGCSSSSHGVLSACSSGPRGYVRAQLACLGMSGVGCPCLGMFGRVPGRRTCEWCAERARHWRVMRMWLHMGWADHDDHRTLRGGGVQCGEQ
jgi:hypothetical protein